MRNTLIIILSLCGYGLAEAQYYQHIYPQDLGDGWQVDSPHTVRLDQDQIKEVIADVASTHGTYDFRSLLVIKNGKPTYWLASLSSDLSEDPKQILNSKYYTYYAIAITPSIICLASLFFHVLA